MDALDTATNAQLDEFFALELAGWTKTIVFGNEIRPWKGPHSDELFAEPPEFTLRADLVLPWLEKAFSYISWDRPNTRNKSRGFLIAAVGCFARYNVSAPTFARAAVIALLRAKRASK